MSRDLKDNNLSMTDEEQEFADLFAEEASPKTIVRVNKGEMVKGHIIAIREDYAFVDLGGKAEGLIDSSELEDMGLKTGDLIEAMVLSTRGGIRLSRTLASDVRDQQMVIDAFEAGLPVQGRIEGRNKGGFDVNVSGQRAFMPVSHLDIGMIEDLDAWIGRTERFKIIEFDAISNRLVVSRSALLKEERADEARQTWETIQVGQDLTGQVRSIQDYGCFVDIGGIDGLVHIKEMQWGRLEHPSEMVSEGQEVSVRVTSIDRERERVGLSMKNANDDPWSNVGDDIQVGSQLHGEVTRLEKYGAFVEVLPGMEGLVHVSELTFSRRIHHPRDILKVGDGVNVTVLEIDSANQRISLSIKQLEKDPWGSVSSEFPLGTNLVGRVERCAAFGVFVEVTPGITALLPRSESGQPDGVDLGRHFRSGDTVEVTVISVNPEDRRMALTLASNDGQQESANMRDYKKKQDAGAAGMGTFADLFKSVKLD